MTSSPVVMRWCPARGGPCPTPPRTPTGRRALPGHRHLSASRTRRTCAIPDALQTGDQLVVHQVAPAAVTARAPPAWNSAPQDAVTPADRAQVDREGCQDQPVPAAATAEACPLAGITPLISHRRDHRYTMCLPLSRLPVRAVSSREGCYLGRAPGPGLLFSRQPMLDASSTRFRHHR